MLQINRILKGINGRIIFFITCCILVIGILLFRLAQLQLNHDKEYITAIREQSLRPIRVPPVRGRIESADGQILVDNKVSYDLVFFVPEFRLRAAGGITRTSQYMKEVLEILAGLLGQEASIKSEDIASKLKDKSKEQIVLIEEVSDKQMKILENRILPPFIVIKGKSLMLDYGKVVLLNRMNGIDRTAENICVEIDRICSMIGRPLQDNREEVSKHIYQRPALPYKALEDLNNDELKIISEMLPPINGTAVIPSARRHYPFPFEYSHLVGYTRYKDISEEDERSHFHYFLPSLYGVEGMEKFMEEELKGSAGKKVVQVNIAGFVQEFNSGKHSVIKQEELDQFNYPAVNGNNVILTIDHEAQKLAYDLIVNMPRERLKVPPKPGKKPRAAFVLMDCTTGEVKAMVSTPSYNMQKYTSGDPAYFEELYGSIDPDNPNKRIHPEWNVPYQLRQEPMINRALAQYEPGSIVKPLLALAALKEGNFKSNHVIECNGFYELPTGRRIYCASRYGHGPVDLSGAIEQSCNKYFITLGLQLTVDKMLSLYRHTGINRYPISNGIGTRFTQEKRGLLPGSSPWYYADTAYSSIGQGKFTLSPLQAAVFVSAIANGGKVLQPQLIREIRDPNNETVIRKVKFPMIVDRLPVSQEHLNQVKEGMRKVVVGEHASGANARAEFEGQLELAGKTGTAEVAYVPKDEEGKNLKEADGETNIVKKIKNTWFTCYGPYDKPKYVAVCFVQGGIYGGTTCAPLIRKFFDTWSKTRAKKME